MTITLRRSEDRFHVRKRGRETWTTFDAENGGDPWRNGFRALRSLDEDHLGPGTDFPHRAAKDTLIVTYVREGRILRQDVQGRSIPMLAGEFQLSDSHPVLRSHISNESRADRAHVFQGCLAVDSRSASPGIRQKLFPVAEQTGLLRCVASPDGAGASLPLPLDAKIFSSRLYRGNHLSHELRAGRGAWLHVVRGQVLLTDRLLQKGDGAAFVDEAAVSLTAQETSEILLFDLA